MFPSPKRVPPPTIKLYRGNTAKITFKGLKFKGEDKTTITEGENILFIVKSELGTTVLSKTLVGNEGVETSIEFDLVPEDTINLFAPYIYHYSVDLYNSDITEFYTLQKGDVIFTNPIGTIRDIPDTEIDD